MRRTLIFLVPFFLWAPTLSGDRVFLQNGDRWSGVVLGMQQGVLRLDTEFVGETKIPWNVVEEMTLENPLQIRLRDGQVLFGTLTTTNQDWEIHSADAGVERVGKNAIQSIGPPPSTPSGSLSETGFFDFWNGSLDAGLSTSRGNAETLTVNVGLRAARTTQSDKLSFYLTSLRADNKTGGRTVTTANTLRTGTRYEKNVARRLFTFGFADFEFDEFQQLDLRSVLGGGLGVQIKRSSRTRFDWFGGASFSRELFSTGLTRRSAEALAGEELRHQFSSAILLAERLVFYPNLSGLGEYRVTFDSSLTTKLNSWLSWNIQLSDRFLSNPTGGAKRNDLLLTTGISLTFGEELSFVPPTPLPEVLQQLQ